MKVRYSDEEHFDVTHGSIFLAGPTPRSNDVMSWRPKALEILRELNFTGVAMVPERSSGDAKFEYSDQVAWERFGLCNADAIVFWVPRNLETMPAFTTNVEFGYWLAKSSERIFYGRPPDAPKNAYLDWLFSYDKRSATIHSDLKSLLEEAVDFVRFK